MENIKENNKIISEFMGYKFYHPGIDIDNSECGGLYERFEIFSKTPILVEEYPNSDQYYFAEVPNPDFNKEKPLKWRSDRKTLSWATINSGKYLTNLQYHKSWDWLMPVIEKIDGSCEYGITWCHIKTDGTEIVVHDISSNKNIFECYPKKNTQEATKLSVTYNAVVRYIKWYNNQ